MKDTKCTKCLGLLLLTLTLLYLKTRVWKLCSFVNTPPFLLGTKMPAVSDVTDSPGSDQTLLISASCKAPRGRIPHSLPLLLPQLSKQTGAGWECLLGSGNQSSYLVLKPPAALPGPSLRSDFPVLDSAHERADPALKVGAPWCGCGPGVSALHFRRELGGGGHRASGASNKEELPAASHAASGTRSRRGEP